MNGSSFLPPSPLTPDLANQYERSPISGEEMAPQQSHGLEHPSVDEPVVFGLTRMEESRLSATAFPISASAAVPVDIAAAAHRSIPNVIINRYIELITQKTSDPDLASYYASTPQFMIMNNQIDKLRDYITCKGAVFPPEEEVDARVEEVDARVNDNQFRFKLTPIHVAAMMDNVAAVKCLLSTKLCQVNARDGAGATALFHAAINGSHEVAQLLKENGALDECMKEVEYSKLFAQCHPPLTAASQQVFFREQGQTVQRTGEDFNRLVGSRLIDQDLYICSQEWIEKWKNIQDKDHHGANRARWYAKVVLSTYDLAMRSLYDLFCKNTPRHVYLAFDPAIGFYLCAGEDIPPFTVIGEYLGEVNDALHEEKEQSSIRSIKERATEDKCDEDEKKFLYCDQPRYHYQLGGRTEAFWDSGPYGGMEWKTKTIEVIDAHDYRSLMAMVNCSFPNVIARPVLTPYNMIRVLFITMESVSKDTPFAFDYGPHSVKRMRYREMREAALESFVASTDLEAFASNLPKSEKDYSDDLQERLRQVSEEAKLDYLLQTPTAILSLTIKGLLSFAVIDKLFRSKYQIKNKETEYRSTMEGTFMWELKEMIKYKRLTEPRKTELLDAIGKEELLTIYRMLRKINQNDNPS